MIDLDLSCLFWYHTYPNHVFRLLKEILKHRHLKRHKLLLNFRNTTPCIHRILQDPSRYPHLIFTVPSFFLQSITSSVFYFEIDNRNRSFIDMLRFDIDSPNKRLFILLFLYQFIEVYLTDWQSQQLRLILY